MRPTQIDEQMFQALSASLRGANRFPKRMYLTCNPGGVGHGWVKRLFIDREYRGAENPADYRFIPASIYDNEALMRTDPDYVKRLENLPEEFARPRGFTAGGMSFPVSFFRSSTNGGMCASRFRCRPLPRITARWITGLTCWRRCLLRFCLTGALMSMLKFMKAISLSASPAAKIREKLPERAVVIAPSDLWSRSRDSGRSAAELFAEGGVYFTKIVPDRVNGWLALKEWFTVSDGTPRLRIFRGCRNLIRCLAQLMYDERRPNDAAVEPHELTHAPDALRYFASFRQAVPPVEPTLLRGRNGIKKTERNRYEF